MYDGRSSSKALPFKTLSQRRESISHKPFARELGNSPPTNHVSESEQHRPRMPTESAHWPAASANQMFTLKLLPPVACTLGLTLLVSTVARRPVAKDLHQRMWINPL
ncbi:uncharacterized [Lates japonicus]